MSDPIITLEIVEDEDRLGALDAYDILDTVPEPGYDDIVRLAAMFCDVPVALVSLVAGDRQWFKARIGFPHCETDLSRSVCAHALTAPDLLVIPDLAADPRTSANPLVTGEPSIRFYAGAPLRSPRGHVVGSLCVIDTVPRPGGLTHAQAEVLRYLAGQVVALMELRRAVTHRDLEIAQRRRVARRIGEAHARLEISEAHWRGLFQRLSEGLIIAEVIRDASGVVHDWRYLDVNPAWGELVGVDPGTVAGRTVREVFPDIEEDWIDDFASVVATGRATSFTRQVGTLQRWYDGRAFSLDGDRFAVLFLEVTERVSGEIRRAALLDLGDRLRETTTPEDMVATASAIVGKALAVTRAGYGSLDPEGDTVVIGPDWTAPGTASIAGRHRFADWGEIRQELALNEPLIIRDARTDPRTEADRGRWDRARIVALVNIPIQEGGRTIGVFIVHDDRPRSWSAEEVAFLRNVADRLAVGIARLKAEADQTLLNQELSHRMKNMLSMVQAVARQTLRSGEEKPAVLGFERRLTALASAHDVLLQKSWAAAPLREVLDTALQPFDLIDRFLIAGPRVMLGSRATLSVSLLLHELTTNALKYGALSVDAGQVAVDWRVEEETGELVLHWKEMHGPPATTPTRRGFGSRLITAGLTGGGHVTLRYPPSGFEAEMRAAMEHLAS